MPATTRSSSRPLVGCQWFKSSSGSNEREDAMSYKGPRDHIFLYHAYALALGGWMKDKNGNLTTIDSVAPSVLSIAGGFGSASVHNLNCGARGKHPFGDSGPEGF